MFVDGGGPWGAGLLLPKSDEIAPPGCVFPQHAVGVRVILAFRYPW